MNSLNAFSNSDTLPRRLNAVLTELRAMKPETQAIGYYAEIWKNHLGNDPDLEVLTERFPSRISRADLALLASEADQDTKLQRRAFLATMIWGYGTVGRGPWRTARMLEDRRLEKQLSQAFSSVAAGKLLEAYENITVKWCGPPFVTKFLYVLGLSFASERATNERALLPLVLDSRVARSLQLLHEDGDIVLSEYVKFGPSWSVRQFGKGWLRYIQLLDRWAHEIGCRTDCIEMLLFQPPQAFRDFARD